MGDNESKDSVWPSGQWAGFWTEPNRPWLPQKNGMDTYLSFTNERLSGSGRDRIGQFFIVGNYDSQTMTCYFLKRYQQWDIAYDGHRDGVGIYGQWSTLFGYIEVTGGFHIWPQGLEEKAVAHREEGESLTDAIGKEIKIEQPTLVEV